MSKVLGIVAGKGQFPSLVARGAREQGYTVVMVGFVGHTDPDAGSAADAFTMLHLGQVGKLIDFFHSHKARELCLAGAISKPKALDIRPDLRAMKMIMSIKGKGDDALLRRITQELDAEGFTVLGPARFAPGLVAPEGVQTRRAPTAGEWSDIRFGWPIALDVGRLDIGQLVVVREGIVAAVEALEGTDAALERGGKLGGKGCVALKIFKPGQDDRLDQPAIGPKTIQVMAANGYACLAYQADSALFFDREEAVRLADAADIAIVGIGRQGIPDAP